jgi:hypothetical protein
VTITRFDTAPISSFERTPSGGMRVRGNLSRTGVQVYKMSDGSTRREYRPPEEVFSKESIASFIGAAVTDLHPNEFVNPTNHAQLSQGHVLGAAPGEKHVQGVLDVNTAPLIADVERGDRKEISMGYTADWDPTPGVSPDGEAYDGIQRNIRINHAALGPAGWGRAGPTVALRTDSAYGIPSDRERSAPHKDQNMTTHRVDGIDYEAGSAPHIAAVEKFFASSAKKVEDAEKKANDAAAATAAATKRADDAEKKASPESVHKLASERARILVLANTHVKRDDGKRYDEDPAVAASPLEKIIADVLATLNPGLDTSGYTPEMLGAALASAATLASGGASATAEPVDAGPTPPSALDSMKHVRGSAQLPNQDRPRTLSDVIRDKQKKDADAWRQPVKGS